MSSSHRNTQLQRQSQHDFKVLRRAMLDGWVLKVGELLIPMVAAMRREEERQTNPNPPFSS